MDIVSSLNFIGPLISKYKYRDLPNPYVVARKMFSSLSDNQKHFEKKVLIVPFRMSSVSGMFEGHCAAFLKKRGYTVDALMCGQSIDYCDQLDHSMEKLGRCNLCYYEQQAFLSAFKIFGVFTNTYLDKSEREKIHLEVSQITLSDLMNYKYMDIPVYQALVSAVQLYTKRHSFCFERDEDLVRGFLKTILIVIHVLDKYFKQNKVEFVLLSHGVYATWGIVQEFCLVRSIHFITWGRSYHGAGIIAAHNSSYLSEPMTEHDDEWGHCEFTSRQREQSVAYLMAKVGHKVNTFDFVDYNLKSKKIMERDEIYRVLNLEKSQKIVGLFPNIPWDGQIFRPNIIFSSIVDWVCETIAWFAKNEEYTLIIRTHPAENPDHEGIGDILKNRNSSGLPENVLLIPYDHAITSLSIASISKAVLLYGSMIGFETLYLKIPTILASKFYYSDRNISFDPESKEDYFSLIDAACNDQLIVDEDRYERLLRYTYHYNFRRLLPETLMNLNGLRFVSYKYREFEDLIEDKAMNKFIDCCQFKKKFYFDEFY